MPSLRALLKRRLEHTRRCERARTGSSRGSFVAAAADQVDGQGVAGGVQEGGRARPPPARSAAGGRPEPRAAGVSRSVAMKMTGHKTESVYRRNAVVVEADLVQTSLKLAGCQREW